MGLMEKRYKLLHLLTGKWFNRNTYIDDSDNLRDNHKLISLLPIFTNKPCILSRDQLEEAIRNSIKIGMIFIWDEGSYSVSCYNEFEIIEVEE